MIEVKGDVWDYKADVLLIPSNGDINKAGLAVMGRGVALQASKRNQYIKTAMAHHIKTSGNIVGKLMMETLIGGRELWAFPVKHHWHEKADRVLINQSAHSLREVAILSPERIYVLPRPGCGNGQLLWEDVKTYIEFLPDNVHIIDL